MATERDYSSDNAHFIAGGKTLDIIKQYEADVADPRSLEKAIVRELGAKERSDGLFIFDQPVENPALRFFSLRKPNDDHAYAVSDETPEGEALKNRLRDIPFIDEYQRIFSNRLTGTRDISINPDKLSAPFMRTRLFYGDTEKKGRGDLYQIRRDLCRQRTPRRTGCF